jgi:glycosyltransferase involved in cell wall biosynthesis
VSLRTQVRRAGAPIGRPLRRAAIGLRTRGWPAHSCLVVAQEGADWVLAYEARQLRRIAAGLGVSIGPESWASGVRGQSIFHESQFTLLLHEFERRGNNLGFAYFHGRPGTAGMPEFDACYRMLQRRHAEIDRVQVTNEPMAEVVLSTGIDHEKVHRIPIGVDLATFRPGTASTRAKARSALGIPESAFVVGSFQKDGVGWGEGLEPKLIKGPDVLVAAVERLRERVPELWVLLTGPSRGYVMAALDRVGVPYRHWYLPNVESVATAYEAIDLCVVASREEGGPKAVLESMAVGVPLVTTRVGQAVELVRHGENGWMVDAEDVDGLVEWSTHVAGAPRDDLDAVRRAGLATAERNSYEALTPRWRALLDGFVRIPGQNDR